MKGLDELQQIVNVNLDKLDLSEESKMTLVAAVKESRKRSFRKFSFVSIPATAAVIAFVLVFGNTFNRNNTIKVYADNLMDGITPNKVDTVELDNQFLKATTDFSLDLFRNTNKKGENSLISPTSVYLALGMTANGSNKNTLKEFETTLGKGLSITKLNAYYNTFVKNLVQNEGKNVSIANSIWYKNNESLGINKDFLQMNADYYNAAAYKVNFSDPKTVEDINNWVKVNTGNKIDKILDKIDNKDEAYLINTLYFEAQWEFPYTRSQNIKSSNFTLLDGNKKSVELMYSTEYSYIHDDKVQGFIKPYKGGKYSFVALLPNDGVNINSYIDSISGDTFTKLVSSKTDESVVAAIPKFKSEYKVELVEPLIQMGLKDCFDANKANFTKMTNFKESNIYINRILHKTFIEVDTQGTKAGSVTSVHSFGSSPIKHSVILNRPFIYAIIDNETKMPLFLGTMVNP